MLGELIISLYNKFRVYFYMQVFNKFENREATLTTVESFSMECIRALGEPTVMEFASMMGISAPNAVYKVNNLVEKGYVERVQSETDRREYFLRPTAKFEDYYSISTEYVGTIARRCRKRFTKEELAVFSRMLGIIVDELMPELDMDQFRTHREKKKDTK